MKFLTILLFSLFIISTTESAYAESLECEACITNRDDCLNNCPERGVISPEDVCSNKCWSDEAKCKVKNAC